ncbi:MAG: dTMP kinase [Rickettsiales bacterium]|nr:dTMP kinase [Rickettsiales bacterium]
MDYQHSLAKTSFITFEGCECSGKSTQSRLLYEWFVKNNKKAILTKEPGGTDTADELRSILLDKNKKLDSRSELMLHMASRIEHVVDVILPSLKNGTSIICDRFVDSTIAYQGYGHGLSVDLIKQLHKTFLDDIQPSITFIFDLEFATFQKRVERKHMRLSNDDRYETLSTEFHKRVIRGFKEIAEQNPNRCILIDTNGKSIRTIHEEIIKALI